MFTGLIFEVGDIVKIQQTMGILRLGIRAPKICDQTLKLGDSIAINGICMTVVTIIRDVFEVEAMFETVKRSTLSRWTIGMGLNLERALCLSDRLDGHFVSGHIDGVGEIIDLFSEGGAQRVLIQTDKSLMPLIAPKGSIALDGISLTVLSVNSENVFSVALIPHTLLHTTWHHLQRGNEMNIEVDMMARYAIRYLTGNQKADGLTIEKLRDNGF